MYRIVLLLSLMIILISACKDKPEITIDETKTESKLELDTLGLNEIEKRLMVIGDSLTTVTFENLKKELMKAISEGGFEHAIKFCSLNAIDITNQYVDGVKIQIRRTSDNYRNPKNKPDDIESNVIFDYTYDVHVGETPQPLFFSTGGKSHFFKPILVQSLCLSCHGTPGKDIKPDLYAQIKKIYPEDSAVNYRIDDLRGIWHVIFDQNE